MEIVKKVNPKNSRQKEKLFFFFFLHLCDIIDAH